MRYFSCDLCSKTLGEDDTRFLLRIEGFPIVELSDANDDDDSVEAMDEILTALEKSENEATTEPQEMMPVCSQKQYDLCRCCYQKMLSDPLGLESRRNIPISRN